MVAPLVGMDLKLHNALGPRAESVSFNWHNGDTTWVIYVAPGYESQAADMACHVVKPDVAGTQFANSGFELVDSRGYLLAEEAKPCS